MTETGVIPRHGASCDACGDTGWVTLIDLDRESAYETACPQGCPTVTRPLDDDTEVPF